MKTQLLAFLAPVVLSAGISAQALLTEDFSGGSLDPAKWMAVTQGVPFGAPAVFVQSGECVIQNRGHLVSVPQFDHQLIGPYSVSCKWRCTDQNDRFTMLVRSDGVPSGPYGETQNGVGVAGWVYGSLPQIGIMVWGQIQIGPTVSIGPGLPPILAGTTYTATVVDLGYQIKVRMEGPNPSSQWVEIEAPVYSDGTTQKRVAIHNREQTIGFHQVMVDDIAVAAVAGMGRRMRLLAPVVIGQSSGFVMDHPPSIAGNGFGFAMCSPTFPGAIPVSVPGVVEGVLRLTPLAYGVLGIGVLDPTGVSPAFMFTLPNNPLLVGATFDVQGADVDGFGLMTLTDNDLEVVVGPAAPAPPASLNMVAIAPGAFQMGSPEPLGVAPYFNQPNAQPVHLVTITQPFWMGKYEVTQTEYQAVMGSNPAYFTGADRPVDTVSWDQAVAYCNALTAQEAAAGRLPTGYVYRVPTEAEWEYCCRAGTTTEFHYGSTLLCGQAMFWYSYHSQSSCNSTGTVDVGGYLPNAWGLHDMHGNVWEWCLDSSDGSANYPAGAVADPYVTSGPYRVIRGGGWVNDSDGCRSAARFGSYPYGTYDSVGFRIECDLISQRSASARTAARLQPPPPVPRPSPAPPGPEAS